MISFEVLLYAIPPKRSCDIHTTRICKLFIHRQSQRDLVRSIYIYTIGQALINFMFSTTLRKLKM